MVDDDKMLTLVYRLVQALDSAGVRYCHWKSNIALARAARGDSDLDLLVDRVDSRAFLETLCTCGFKEVRTPVEQQMPGVMDYYGYDKESGKLVHVHAHYQLMLGHDLTKNYHLTLEKPLLETAVRQGSFRVPAPEFELLIFVIRMALKHSTWDVILGGQGKLSRNEREELAYLQSRASYNEMYDLLARYLPAVSAPLWARCLEALQPGCPPWRRAKTGQDLRSSLRAYERKPPVVDAGLKLWRYLLWGVRSRAFSFEPRKHFAGGGAMITIVGGDGSGKSTVVNGLYEWLAPEFDTTRVHMGKPRWSLLTVVVRGLLKVGRSLGLYPFLRAPEVQPLGTPTVAFPGYPWLLREVCTARDRYRTYLEARRRANEGGLVICDRFPLPQVKLMDGPQAERMTRNCPQNWFIRTLAATEKRYYRQIELPELLIVLRADPELAVKRKTDEDPASVRVRSAEVWGINWDGVSAHVIDASRPKGEVLTQLKGLVWSQL
jgi:thymidylate kinase